MGSHGGWVLFDCAKRSWSSQYKWEQSTMIRAMEALARIGSRGSIPSSIEIGAACRHGSTPRDHTDLIIDIFAVDSGLKPLVNEFYDHFKKTIEFCTALKNCLEHARNNHGIIELAVKCYDEEDKLEVGTDEKKSVMALEELRRFKTAEEP
ncbi:hypothetical protein GOBAR_AA15782 [Gossypium barbadense]|uniref:Uncharacterized protein n=1 Tax=Gossypium barbadense TaxID=3634 RepID=A0A2P5XNJ8_GOSBA|nr:hypothetical protein GOBAR_AA15782 [Gossypium barbadense]